MKRWHLLVGVVALIYGCTLFVRVAIAAVPVGCVYPGSLDNFPAVIPGERLLASFFNKVLCAINALEAEVDSVSNPVRSACTSTSAAPGERKLVTLTFTGAPFAGTEPMWASVKDTTNPSRLDADGIQNLAAGLTATVWVFNHDSQASRAGTVCAFVND